MELQDLHKQDHLPHELHEHIENEMTNLEKSLGNIRNSSIGLDTSRSNSGDRDINKFNQNALSKQPFFIGNNPSLESMTNEDPFVPPSPSIFGTTM